MIRFRQLEGRMCLVVECDRCGEQINTGHGNVEWRTWDEDSEWRTTHKPLDCSVKVDSPRERREWPLSDELSTVLQSLVLNTGIDVDRAINSVLVREELGL